MMTREGAGLQGRSHGLPGFPAAAGPERQQGTQPVRSRLQAQNSSGTPPCSPAPWAEQRITEAVLRDCCPNGARGPGGVRAPAGPGETAPMGPSTLL